MMVFKKLTCTFYGKKLTKQEASLSKSDLRSFVIIYFCYATLARFDCSSQIKLENLEYQNNDFEITVPKSKTEITGQWSKDLSCS